MRCPEHRHFTPSCIYCQLIRTIDNLKSSIEDLNGRIALLEITQYKSVNAVSTIEYDERGRS